jgi:hypothetical protein
MLTVFFAAIMAAKSAGLQQLKEGKDVIEMKICTKCGAENEESAAFCANPACGGLVMDSPASTRQVPMTSYAAAPPSAKANPFASPTPQTQFSPPQDSGGSVQPSSTNPLGNNAALATPANAVAMLWLVRGICVAILVCFFLPYLDFGGMGLLILNGPKVISELFSDGGFLGGLLIVALSTATLFAPAVQAIFILLLSFMRTQTTKEPPLAELGGNAISGGVYGGGGAILYLFYWLVSGDGALRDMALGYWLSVLLAVALVAVGVYIRKRHNLPTLLDKDTSKS